MKRGTAKELTNSERIDELVAESNRHKKYVYKPGKKKHEYVPPPPISESAAAAIEAALPRLKDLPRYFSRRGWNLRENRYKTFTGKRRAFKYTRIMEWHLDEFYQRKIIEENWTPKMTEVLEATVRNWEAEAVWHVEDALLATMSEKELSRFYFVFWRYKIPWNPNTFIHYAVDKATKLGMSYEPPKVKKCVRCGELFSEADITLSIAMHVEHPRVSSDYCLNCLCSAFWGLWKTRRSREEMITDLQRITAKIGFVPSGDLFTPHSYKEKNKMPKDTLRSIIGNLADAATYEMYKREFGTWSNVLTITGLKKVR